MFRYRPRNRRVPPEAPEPETPAQSDSRFVRLVVRFAIVAILIGLLGVAIVGTGIFAPVVGILLVAFAIVYALIPEFRRRTNRIWVWQRVTGLWWWPYGWDYAEPRERDPDDPNRGDHLL